MLNVEPAADVHALVAQLQAALGVSLVCGQITLNINNGDFSTYNVNGHFKAPPKRSWLDKPEAMRA